MKYFSKDNRYINAKCQSCGRVLKIPHKKCTVVLGGLSITPAVICQCGTISNFIEDESSDYQKNTGGTRMKNDHHMPELINKIERCLPLNQLNFRMSAQYISYADKWNSVFDAQNYYGLGYPIVLFDSETCRIRVEYSWSPRAFERSINIRYGRLGIPDDANWILSNTNPENYHLYWHNIYPLLYFLDGLSPQDAKNAKQPQLVMDFEQSDLTKSTRYEPEKDILLHATIWEAYGQRFFGIFDAQNKDLWKEYSIFISEYWKAFPKA